MLEDISPEQIKDQFKKNRNLRISTYVVGGVVVLILGYFAYRQFMFNPGNEKSKEGYYTGLNFAAADSTDAAIDELRPFVNKNDGYVGGEVAQFVLARQLMAAGEFTQAINELEGVDVDDTYLQAMSVGLIADCYSEMEKYQEAAETYLEAAEINENEMTSPMYLMKAGLCAEQLKDFETAATCYNRIKDDYPSFAGTKSIEKYIARAENSKTE